MKELFTPDLQHIADNPLVYGLSAAIVRWTLGDKRGGWIAFLSYVVSSIMVAYVANFYLQEEMITSGKKTAYIILLAFVARDLLGALLIVGSHVSTNPLDFASKVLKLVRGKK